MVKRVVEVQHKQCSKIMIRTFRVRKPLEAREVVESVASILLHVTGAGRQGPVSFCKIITYLPRFIFT